MEEAGGSVVVPKASLAWGFLLLGLLSLAPLAAGASLPTFEDVTGPAGIDFLHAGEPSTDAIYIEIMGSGACWFDYDDDDRLDLFLVNAQYSNQTKMDIYDPRSKLYKNNGNGTFTDVTQDAGLSLQSWGQGCAAGDYDNDFDDDLFLSAYSRQYLFRNNGNGTFTNVTAEAGTNKTLCENDSPCFSESAAWLDYDLDGDLDLYLVNYLQWDIRIGGFASPAFYPAQCNVMWRNNGDGTFTDVTTATGTGDCDGNSLAIATGDVNNDGWQDIFVASDETNDDLYRNDRNGSFDEVALDLGVADWRGGMGVDLEDLNGDNKSDITITHYDGERFALYKSNGGGTYDDVAATDGLDSTRNMVGWGTAFHDVDNDGFVDVSYANGHVSLNYTGIERYGLRNRVFRGLANGTFQDITDSLGEPWKTAKVSRGMAIADYDMDGFWDYAFVNNPNQTADLWRSQRAAGNFLTLRLEGNGTGVNTNAYGAKVWFEAGGKEWSKEVGASSYLSQHSLDLHVGLGALSKVDKASIRWPSDPPTWLNLTNLDANRILKVQQSGEVTVLRELPIAGANMSKVTIEKLQDVSLGGVVTRAPRNITAREWSWGDGNTSSTQNATHSYADVGTYTARFRITDEAGLWDEAAVEVVVVNKLPLADAGADQTGNRVDALAFNGSGSTDPDGAIVNWTWDMGEGSTLYGQQVEHTYLQLGIYEVRLTVRDSDGGEANDTARATIVNLAPVAHAGPDLRGKPSTSFVFNGSASFDRDGTVTTWAWDFGDGANNTGRIVEHQYASAGTYTATLTVTDPEGAQATDTAQVVVSADNAKPVADAGPDQEGDRITDVGLDGSASRDPDGSIANFTWDYGDGSTGFGPLVKHRFTSLGTFNVSLIVTDNEGATATDHVLVTVRNLAPVAEPGPSRDIEGLAPVVFDGSASRDPDGSVASLTWDFGDGSIAQGAMVQHTYARYGRYNVTLTVEDNDGFEASAITRLWLYAKPVAVLGPLRDREASRIEAQPFNGSGSSDADGTIVGWRWDLGDGANATGPLAQHRYTRLGDFTATLTVTDDDGWQAVDRVLVRVVNLKPVPCITSYTLANLNQTIPLDGTCSYDPDGTLVKRDWWLGDSAASGQVVYHFWTATGPVQVVHTVLDNDGDANTTTWSLEVVDWLRVGVGMVKDEWTAGEKPSGTVEVRYANGLPVKQAEVNVTIAYHVRDPLGPTATDQTLWRAFILNTTRNNGLVDFTAPSAQRQILGLQDWPYVSAPTVGHAGLFGQHSGSYDVDTLATWRGNSGAADTAYYVRLLFTQDLG